MGLRHPAAQGEQRGETSCLRGLGGASAPDEPRGAPKKARLGGRHKASPAPKNTPIPPSERHKKRPFFRNLARFFRNLAPSARPAPPTMHAKRRREQLERRRRKPSSRGMGRKRYDAPPAGAPALQPRSARLRETEKHADGFRRNSGFHRPDRPASRFPPRSSAPGSPLLSGLCPRFRPSSRPEGVPSRRRGHFSCEITEK